MNYLFFKLLTDVQTQMDENVDWTAEHDHLKYYCGILQ